MQYTRSDNEVMQFDNMAVQFRFNNAHKETNTIFFMYITIVMYE